MNFLILFAFLSFVNVVFSTARSIITINGNKWVASFVNAAYFSFYNIMLIITVADFSLVWKCIITFAANLVGVFIVKYFEEKHAPIKMWKIELALPKRPTPVAIFKTVFEEQGIECNYLTLGKWDVFNCYCETKEQTKFLKKICQEYNGRISAYESANL